jgi:hypothetical protein
MKSGGYQALADIILALIAALVGGHSGGLFSEWANLSAP